MVHRKICFKINQIDSFLIINKMHILCNHKTKAINRFLTKYIRRSRSIASLTRSYQSSVRENGKPRSHTVINNENMLFLIRNVLIKFVRNNSNQPKCLQYYDFMDYVCIISNKSITYITDYLSYLGIQFIVTMKFIISRYTH